MSTFSGSFIFTLKAQVERVFLNALARYAALPPDFCAFGDIVCNRSEPGLVFSGEADPP
jgi:hypothetical protein